MIALYVLGFMLVSVLILCGIPVLLMYLLGMLDRAPMRHTRWQDRDLPYNDRL